MQSDDSIPYRVDLEALHAFIESLATFDRAVERRTSEVDCRITDLHADWSGADAAAQLANHQQWIDGVAEMRRAEEVLEEAADKAHRNYRGVGEHNQRMWP
ncbi:WXG100 family type VII secretion target [Mycobacteroides abscessus]|uniref:WXG100 family type VII secretion target n=1 Tax=Mycobacteroides abscessus TaxID=36809 RepID=UPI0009A88A31|nr:WXG100 family type VII secretion target [Mycobacteroides abscessus]SLF39138.1 ESAT-6-like protein 12 [Mycobacteroides abscessus subsp. bolletii]